MISKFGNEELCKELLSNLGENPQREGLIKTPKRFAKAFEDLTRGYTQDLDRIINNAIFSEECGDMVIVKQIEFYSLCEHHLLPFFGHAHVAYIPNGKIIGLSKIPRIVNMFSRRLQVQERLTHQIAETIEEILAPQGVACIIEASHMCMMMRGIQSQSSSLLTSSMRGAFLNEHSTRDEFLKLVMG